MAKNGVTIEDFKEQIDIYDVISRVVPLKGSGDNFKGCCPFHNEKTPSFVVSVKKGIFTCFGCGKSGDVLKFTQEYYGLTFQEACEKLAKEYSLTAPSFAGSGNPVREKYYEINKEAARFFYKAFSETNNPAYPYMKNRGLTDATLKKFGIGYADEKWDSLYQYLKEKGFEEKDLVDLGLIRKSKKDDKYYDYFRNRVMFPIINAAGKVIGFGGRKLREEDEPKYLNTNDNEAYSKKNNLYAINFSKQEAAKDGYIILVEGYMDVISLYQSGIHNVSASCGTALTENQARLIKKYTKNVVLSYDADNAGRAAALRGIDVLEAQGLKTKVLHVTDGKDPDEFVKKNGRDAFIKLIEGATPAMDYKLNALKGGLDLEKADERLEFIKRSAKLIKSQSPATQDIYIKKLAEDFRLSEGAIRKEVMGTEVTDVPQVNTQRDEVAPTSFSQIELALIKLAMIEPNMLNHFFEIEDAFKHPLAVKVKNIMFELYGTKGGFAESDVFDRLEIPESEYLMPALENVIIAGKEEAVMNSCIMECKLRRLVAREKELIDLISVADNSVEKETMNKLTLELMQVQKEKKNCERNKLMGDKK